MLQLQNLFENNITLIYLSYVSKEKILSILIGILPISYIFGTFIVNINIVLIVFSGILLFFKGKRFTIMKVDILIILFFSYILYTSIYNTIEINSFNQNKSDEFYILNKSIFVIIIN